MFVRKKKYEKLEQKYNEMSKHYLKRINQCEELKVDINFLINEYERLSETSLNYDEVMSLLHEEYTALQSSQIMKNFNITFDSFMVV